MRVLTGIPDASDSSRTVMPAMALSAETAFAIAWFMSMRLERAGGGERGDKCVPAPDGAETGTVGEIVSDLPSGCQQPA